MVLGHESNVTCSPRDVRRPWPREFKEKIRGYLPCRITGSQDCDDIMEQFLNKCFYVAGPASC